MAKLTHRPRRNRKSENLRDLLQENLLTPSDFVLPLFVVEGHNIKEPISSMPDYHRLSVDNIVKTASEAYSLGITSIALFPSIEGHLKNPTASESVNPEGLLQRTIKELKNKLPDLVLFTDVAMDPYSSEGHDGVVEKGEILNDPTLDILAKMAISQAQAGADLVAPSDMMDGRVGYIRKALDESGHENVGILAYTAKYASSFYGPFREALNSAPKFGDKKTYQMNPANTKDALRELQLDLDEGADIVMVKPALAYLDIISLFKKHSSVPVAAYNVSGEYSLIKAASEKGWIDEDQALLETLMSIKRAGANVIFTYFAMSAAKILNQ